MFKKRNKFKPNPFVVTIHDEADGGPVHILSLFTGYCVSIRKNGTTITDALVLGVDDDKITITPWNEASREYDGPITSYNIWDGTFDEVMYL